MNKSLFFLVVALLKFSNSSSDSGSYSRSPILVTTHHWTKNPTLFLNSPQFDRGFASKRSRLKPPLRVLRQRGKPNEVLRRTGPTKSVVRFFIYPDQANPSYQEEIVVGNNASLSSYRGDLKLIILIQDYMQNYSNIYPQRTKDAYLTQKFESNIIIADWKAFGSPKFGRYPRISRKVTRISRAITNFLLYLSTQNLLPDPSSVHLIGFSLGAQIAGVCGNNFKRATGSWLGRITGLDPQSTGLQYTAQSEKLDAFDAIFVDVYHTTTSPFGFGTSIGTVDFYPNGGSSQPGCKGTALFDMMKDIGMESEYKKCAHHRAWDYFTDSIFNKKLYACKSNSYLMYKMKTFCAKPQLFGEYVSNEAQGDYFLDVVHKD